MIRNSHGLDREALRRMLQRGVIVVLLLSVLVTVAVAAQAIGRG